MFSAVKHLAAFFQGYSANEKKLIAAFKSLTGKRPLNINVFKLALQHRSMAPRDRNGFVESNERLEFLGDAVLSSIVADYLFKKYPYKDEGFLTEIRSRIVNRESLNVVARKLGVPQLMNLCDAKLSGSKQSYKSIYGNSLEAIVGAIYLDRGYSFCYQFVQNKIIAPNFNLSEIVASTTNFKSKLIEWGQKEVIDVRFETSESEKNGKFKEFISDVIVDGKSVCKGYGHNKKKAEQDAAFNAIEKLNI
ncbi:MAG: ribonuclease III [Cyclobacteriaceae bacterium]|nr:ribonuclease III [Cyclobacteriaceae bacterium]